MTVEKPQELSRKSIHPEDRQRRERRGQQRQPVHRQEGAEGRAVDHRISEKNRVAKSQATRNSLRKTKCDEAVGKNDSRGIRGEDKIIVERSLAVLEGSNGFRGAIGHREYSAVEATRKLDAITEYADVERQR